MIDIQDLLRTEYFVYICSDVPTFEVAKFLVAFRCSTGLRGSS